MKRGLTSVLALVIGQRAIVLAHVAAGKPDAVAKRVGQFLLDDPAWLDKPADAGRALRAFLDSHGFDSSNAIVGVPARWLLAQEKDLPPTDPAAAAAILRLSAERLSLSGSAPLVADFAGKPSASAASKVLLVGMLRSQFDKIEKFTSAAGLTLQAVCPTSLGALRTLAGESSLLRLADDGAELVTQDAGVPTMIRPITAAPQQLAAELKRTLAMRPAGSDRLAISDGTGLSETDRDALTTRIGPRSSMLGDDCPQVGFDSAAMNDAATGLSRAAALPAIALASAALRGVLPVDFADTKLAEIPESRFGRKAYYAIAAAAVLVIGVVALEWHIESREAQATEIAKQVADITPKLKTAKAAVDQLDFGRPYFAPHPPQLDCLRQLTLAFNYEEPIWADDVQLRDTGLGSLAGKSANQSLAIALIDRLKAQPLLSAVQMADLRNGTGKEKETSYNMTFTFNPAAAK